MRDVGENSRWATKGNRWRECWQSGVCEKLDNFKHMYGGYVWFHVAGKREYGERNCRFCRGQVGLGIFGVQEEEDGGGGGGGG